MLLKPLELPIRVERDLILTDCCICFVTNKTYLFPTVVSAIQAKAHSSRTLADVAVFCVDKESAECDDFAKVCELESIGFSYVNPAVTDNSHVAFGRLFLDEFVPRQYSQFLYVDGDTQVLRSLDPLISANVPAGQFMAATDPLAFTFSNSAGPSKEIQAYLDRIGVPSVKHYFNSGVLRINRDGWARTSSKAYDLCAAFDKSSLHFWDQDGLNAVAATSDVRLPMSLRFNFPIFLRNCRVEREVSPAIYHFMSAPKPWNGIFPPWNKATTAPYRELCKRHPSIAAHRKSFSALKHARYILQQRAKQLNESISWGWSWRRQEILAYEQSCPNLANRFNAHWA